QALITRCIAQSERETGDTQQYREQTIAAVDTGLQVISKDKHPEDWAALHSCRAVAYLRRAAGNRQSNLNQAMADCEAALTVYTLKDHPHQRAIVLNNREIIRAVLGQGDTREYTEQSINDQLDA